MSERSALQKELRQNRPFSSRQDEATVGVLRTADVLRHRLDGVFAPRGLTAQQYNVLRILRGAHPNPMQTMEIAERMIERTPGITRLLDRLERKNLVRHERRPDDRRCVLRSITPAGLELLAELDEPVAQANHEAMGMLKPEQTERLIELLDTIRAGQQ